MADQAEGRQAQLVFIEQAVFGTLETPPATGFALPYTNMDLNPGEGFTDFEEIDALSVPTAPMGAKHQPTGRFELPLHYDSWGWPLKYAVATPVTTLTGPYLHTFTLGGTIAPGFEIERKQADLTKGNRLFYSGRVSTMDFALDLEGAVKMTLDCGFMRNRAWTATDQCVTPTTYTSEPVDSLLGIIKIGGTEVGYVAAFNFTLDWKLDQDKYPVGNQGWRSSLSRGKPMFGGSLDVFLDDDTVTDLIEAADAQTAVSFEVLIETTAVTESVSFQITNAKLKQTGEPVQDSSGVNVQFDWKASGAGCFVVELYNSVTSY